MNLISFIAAPYVVLGLCKYVTSWVLSVQLGDFCIVDTKQFW